MIASPLLYWTMLGCAVAIYLGVNVHFLYAVLPPRNPVFRSVWRAVLGHWLPQAAVLASLVLLMQMIVAPLLLISTVLLFLLVANNKKFASLNEPLLPSDVAMALRRLHVWRLLGRYIRRDRTVLVLLPTAVLTTMVVLACEPWMFGGYRLFLPLLSPLPMLIFWPPRGQSWLIRHFKANEIAFLDWDIAASVAGGGLIPTFLGCMDTLPRPMVSAISGAKARTVLAEKFANTRAPCPPPGKKPNIVVVLAEAFADPRAIGIAVEPNPLPNYDDAVRRSVCSGRAWVPVYGGWTIRTEYSLLTGINLLTFANNVGNPNTTLVCPATHSLPKHLKKHGYHTLMVHPYDRRFYGRDNACGPLGFDAFLDEHDFVGAPREGPYVSDVAVAERIEQELHQATSPTFLFCVTIENHGPWDDSEALPETMEPFTTQPVLSPASHSSLARYVRHLHSADRMIRRLTDMVAAAQTPTIVLVVGDHLPGLTDLFREANCPIFQTAGEPWLATAPFLQTPYFLLSNIPAERRELNCDISFLPGLVLDCAGLNGDSFFHDNSAMRRHLNGNIHSDADPAARQAYLRFCYEVAVFPERYAA